MKKGGNTENIRPFGLPGLKGLFFMHVMRKSLYIIVKNFKKEKLK